MSSFKWLTSGGYQKSKSTADSTALIPLFYNYARLVASPRLPNHTSPNPWSPSTIFAPSIYSSHIITISIVFLQMSTHKIDPKPLDKDAKQPLKGTNQDGTHLLSLNFNKKSQTGETGQSRTANGQEVSSNHKTSPRSLDRIINSNETLDQQDKCRIRNQRAIDEPMMLVQLRSPPPILKTEKTRDNTYQLQEPSPYDRNYETKVTPESSGTFLRYQSQRQEQNETRTRTTSQKWQSEKTEMELEVLSLSRELKQTNERYSKETRAYQQEITDLKVQLLTRNAQVRTNEPPRPRITLKETRSVQVNTEPLMTKQHIEKFQPQEQQDRYLEVRKTNSRPSQQLQSRETECEMMLNKIDQVEKYNNKLIGTVEELKRELQSQRETNSILQDNLSEQRSVIQSQKNTINKIQVEYSEDIIECNVEIEELKEKIGCNRNKRTRNTIGTPPESRQFGIEGKTHSNSEKNFPMNQQSGGTAVKEKKAFSDFQEMFKPQNKQGEEKVGSGSVTPHYEFKQHSSPPVKEPPVVKRLNMAKLEKKISCVTCELKPQTTKKEAQEGDSKSVSARAMKSPRVQTPHDLKTSIKAVLDNSVLLGKGVQILEMLSSIIKLVEMFTGFPYNDVTGDLDKKKETEKSAFSNKLFKDIAEINRIRAEYEQGIEQTEEENRLLLKDKDDKIKQLTFQKVRVDNSNETLLDKVKILELQVQRAKKTELQKETGRKLGEKQSEQSQTQQIEKLRQQKTLLLERISKFKGATEQLENTKRKLHMENEKQKVELLCLKSEFNKMDVFIREIENIKTVNANKTKRESVQFADALIKCQLESDLKRRQAYIQLRARQEDMSLMAEQSDVLRRALKQRENDLIEVGKQVSQIRTAQMRMQDESGEKSITLLNTEMTSLTLQLRQRQEQLTTAQKQANRAKNEVVQLQKLLQAQKEKTKVSIRQKRQLTEDLSRHLMQVESLQRAMSFMEEVQSYDLAKTGDEFEEVINALYKHSLKKAKPVKRNNLALKSATSTRSEQGNLLLTNVKKAKEQHQIRQTVKAINEAVYETYSALPFSSQENTLFEAETKEELMSQLRDIKKFAERYSELKKDLDTKLARRENAFVGLIRSLVKMYGTEQKILVSTIEELRMTPAEQKQFQNSLLNMVSLRDINSPYKTQDRQSKPPSSNGQ